MIEINTTLNDYIQAHTSAEDELLRELTRVTHLHVIQPRMLSGHLQGKVLEMFSHMIRPHRILEIGTFTGYSALCLARGLNEGGRLHTIELNDELIELAQKFIQRSALCDKIVQHQGNALDIIQQLDETFELVFIDGDKREYCAYYQAAFDKVARGGYILADNVLWDGKVVEPVHANDKHTLGVLAFNQLVMADTRVENVLLPFRDGMMLARKL